MRPFHMLIAAVFAGVFALAFMVVAPAGRDAAPVTPAAVADDSWTAPVWTGGRENAERHWQKHGAQFPEFRSAADYIDGVHAFLLHPPAGTLIKHRQNGDTLYFDPASGVFAVQAAGGAPRTFFKPGDGMAYWERQ